MSWWTADRKRYALNYLLSAGLSPYGAAGLVSRWANVESIASGPYAVNPTSGAFGIAQWLGSRLPAIRGNTNFEAQLAYVIRELNGSEARAGNILRSANNAQQGAIGASVYERAEGYNANSGYDNFTNRTATGISALIAMFGNIPGAVTTIATSVKVNPVIPFPSAVDGYPVGYVTEDLATSAPVGATALLLGAGILTLYLISR